MKNYSEGFAVSIYLSEPISDPEKEKMMELLEKDGFLVYDYETNDLKIPSNYFKDNKDEDSFSFEKGRSDAVLRLSPSGKYVRFRIDDDVEPKLLEALFDRIISHLGHLEFGYIDREGDSPEKFSMIVSNYEIKWIFKINYFGKKYLDKYGKSFFEELSGIKNHFHNNGVFKLLLSENLKEEVDEKLQKEIISAFKSIKKDVQFYDVQNYSFE